MDLLVTLCPSFDHFLQFVYDNRLSGIRINSAMLSSFDLEGELEIVKGLYGGHVPLYFDVKGRQPRIAEVIENPLCLDVRLNHPIEVRPSTVLFKAGEDSALLKEVCEDGYRLIFENGRDYGPKYTVRVGDSLHFRDPSYRMLGKVFTDLELEKIERVVKAGFKRYFLSYVEEQSDVDQFLELVGSDCEVMLKIETIRGLGYVVNQFVKRPNLKLVNARGDLYVEVKRPHDIFLASQLIVDKDPEACVGSRLLLSVIPKLVPTTSDFFELGWFYDHGYRSALLCDEICLRGDYLNAAIEAFDCFRRVYGRKRGGSL